MTEQEKTMPEQVHERRQPQHVTADPGIGGDHEPSESCWCRPSAAALYPLERGQAPVFLHRGSSSRITRLTERNR
jgi:hypothetical protein